MPIAPTFFETFEHLGVFWLPETPNRKQPGTLRFTETKIELELIGTLKGTGVEDVRDSHLFPECIMGVTSNGKPRTLHDCAQASVNVAGGPGKSVLRATRLFIGGHYATADDMKFDSVSVNFSDLEEWLGHFPFSFDPRADSRPDGGEV